MITPLRSATLVVAIAIIGLNIPAYGMARNLAAAQDEQRVLDDVIRAQIDLTAGRGMTALDEAARAETVLLNAQQSGDYQDPNSLAALERAHADLLGGKSRAAMTALHSAENDLTTPLTS